jgi:ligand-binding sensor protein
MKNDRVPRPSPKISLTDLIPLSDLQEMQDSFSEVANVPIRIVDPNGAYITTMSNVSALCAEALSNKAIKEKLCDNCRPTFLGGEGIVDDDLSFECLPGLKNYLIPLKVPMGKTTSLILGYMIIGPVIFMKRKAKEEFIEIAESVGIDAEQFWNLVLALRVFSYKGIRSFLDMVENLTSHILNLAYDRLVIQKKILNDLSREALKKSAPALGQLKEFLELFLDLIIDVTRGTVGSVMLFDHRKNALVIKAAHGLPPDIVRKTALKIGEGVSGLAAQMKKALLINEDSSDEIIAERLKRPDLFSSLVVPIKSREEVYGVITVPSDRTYPVKFNETTLSFLTKAAGLAGVALEHLQS